MQALIKKTRTLWHDSDGPTATEFAVFLALIVFAYWAVTTLMGR